MTARLLCASIVARRRLPPPGPGPGRGRPLRSSRWASWNPPRWRRIGGAPVPAPVPAQRIDIAGDNLYLASATRIFQNLDGGPCEQIPPKVTLRPRRRSLAAFKRGRLRMTVKEPVHLAFFVEARTATSG